MVLPKPVASKAVNTQLSDRVIINCVLANPSAPESSGVIYSIGPSRVDSLDRLSNRLAASKAATPNLQVVIRADKRLPFHAVREVMAIVAENRIEVMNLVAHVGEGVQFDVAQ
jgi:hypothetical protein